MTKMKTAEIKDFITKQLLLLPEWNEAFVDCCPDNTSKKMFFNTKYWYRNRKFKFSSWDEFLKKEYGEQSDYVFDPTDVWSSDVEPYGAYPEDNNQYVFRELCFSTAESNVDNTCPDIRMSFITDSTDTKIVCVTATAD